MNITKVTKVTLETDKGETKAFDNLLDFTAILHVPMEERSAYVVLRSHDIANALGMLAVGRERILTELRTEIAMSLANSQMVGEYPDAANIR